MTNFTSVRSERVPTIPYRRLLLLAVASGGLLLLAAGCTGHEKKIALFQQAYGRAQFSEAQKEIDKLIAKESGAKLEEVESSDGLSDSIKVDKGDTFLYLLDKSMVCLAQNKPEACLDLLRRSRDVMDERLGISIAAAFGSIKDDTALPYRGADYEHIVARVMIAISDLLIGGKDAYAYALQIGEKQEEILGSDFGDLKSEDGEQASYNPRKQYERLAIGAYMEGIIQESRFSNQAAGKAYARAKDWAANVQIVNAAHKRMENGRYAGPGNGVVHVFYLAGRGPQLVETTSPVTDQALALARVGAAIAGAGASVMMQTSVPVPAVKVHDSRIRPLEISVPDGTTLRTETILNVNQVAEEQLKANMPWIIARAVVRRAAKATGAAVIQHGVASRNNWWLGFLAGALFNLFTTAIENADTRSWVSLPAEIQVARFEAPPGESTFDFGDGMQAHVKVSGGHDSYVVVLRPDLTIPGVILPDQFSQVDEPVEAAPQP